MSFSNMLEILQEKNKGKIVLVKLGVFYIATGKDAVLLNNLYYTRNVRRIKKKQIYILILHCYYFFNGIFIKK